MRANFSQNNEDEPLHTVEFRRGEDDEEEEEEEKEEEEEEEEEEEDEHDDSDKDEALNETITSFFTGKFRAFSANRPSNVLSTVLDSAVTFNGMIPLWEASYHVQWDKYIGRNYPFNTPQNLILQALVNGDDDQLSRKQLEKILYVLELLLKLKEDAVGSNKRFKLPTLDNIWNFQIRKRNRIPTMTTTVKTEPVTCFNKLENKEETINREIYLNLPSEHIKLITANPKKAGKVTMLPDRTPDQSLGLHQGKKWKECLSFQHPMITEKKKGLLGSVVKPEVF